MQKVSKAMRVSTAAAATVLMASTASFAQEPINSNGWYKACSDQGENKICNVQYQAVASTGQVITSINLAEITGSIERKVFQVTVPTGRMIPPGLRVKIEGAEESKVPYSFCTPRVCAAEKKLDDALVAQLKAGAKIELISINWRGKENPLTISLEGFGAAYDGAPIKPDELRQRQQKLEEKLQEKSKTVLEKLQEAQEKARESGGSASE